jgi:hypothetical protein
MGFRSNTVDNVKLRPKLKEPDREVAVDEAPKPLKRMMGFREWCEKVYEPSKAASTRLETDR